MNDQKEEIIDSVNEDGGIVERDDAADDTYASAEATESQKQQDHKTCIAVIIILAGITCGALFVDVAQLFGQKGFSARAIRDAQVVEYNGDTWVRFDDPKVVVEVFEAEDCEECVTDEVLTQLRTVLPTLEAHRIDVNSEEGKAYAKMHNIAHIPAFLFSPQVTETDFYQQTAILFKESKDKYFLDTATAGIPVGQYIAQPSANSGILYGDSNAQVKVVVFHDLTAPDSKALYDKIKKINAEYGGKVIIAVKPLADPEQKVAQRVAMGVLCAYTQDQYDAFFNTYYGQRQRITDEATVDDALIKIARTIKLNEEQFATCLNDQQKMDELTKSVEEAKRFGVQMLPSVFVNENLVTEKVDYDTLKTQIDALLNEEGNSTTAE